MPWCLKCRTEYRPGITRCADCGSALVDELLPEPEPEEVAEPEEEPAAAEAPRVPIGSGALSGPRLFLWSARRAARMGNLWVLFGATLLVSCVLALVEWELPSTPRPPSPLSPAEYVRAGLHSLQYEWGEPSQIARSLSSGLTSPLRRGLTFFGGFGRFARSFAPPPGSEQANRTPTYWLLYAASLLVDALVFGLLLAGIYGWIVRGLRGERLTLRSFGVSVKRQWRALFAWGATTAAITLLVILDNPLPRHSSEDYVSASVARTTLTTWLQLPLALAPFLVVAEGIGFLEAFVRSLHVVRRRWLALLGLVVLYRAGYVLLDFVGFPLHAVRTNLWLPAVDVASRTPGVAAGVAGGLALLVAESLAWVWLELSLCTALLTLALPEGQREEPKAVAEPAT